MEREDITILRRSPTTTAVTGREVESPCTHRSVISSNGPVSPNSLSESPSPSLRKVGQNSLITLLIVIPVKTLGRT